MINTKENTFGQRKIWIDYYGSYFSMPTFTIGRVLADIVYGHYKGQKTDNWMNGSTHLISMHCWLYVGEYRLWTSKRTENRPLNEWDYTIDKYETLAIC